MTLTPEPAPRATVDFATAPAGVARVYVEGVAVVMPAYNEQDNLEASVEDFLTTLDGAGVEHRVVVVDDGSTDRTGEVLAALAERHHGRVVAVRHRVNRGYGAAVRAGIAAALERTEMRRILLTDADGQFRAEDLLTFLQVQRERRADAVIGYREPRADPPGRVVNAFLWNQASRWLLRTGSRDVDCAYKLLDRRLLEGVELKGEAAAISPELLVKIRAANALITEQPVNHHPRVHGRPTGGQVSVAARSLVSLLRVCADLARSRRRRPQGRPLLRRADPVLLAVTAVAVAASVVAAVAYHLAGWSLAYPDAVSHLLISRRVVASPTAGLAQLGGVWLPLPHLLTLPLVWVQALYASGVAATVVSMAAFVVAARYLYLIAARLTGTRWAGVVAALVLVGNPNALYLQATPMTETLLVAGVAGAVFHLQEWCRSRRYGQLGAAALATLVATLTRYEGWALTAAMCVVVGGVALRGAAQGAVIMVGRWRFGLQDALRGRDGRAMVEANLLFFGAVALSGVAGWVVWNLVIFGDPLNFLSGSYAKPSLWVAADEPAVGDWSVALRTYVLAMARDIGPAALALAAAGAALHLTRTRLEPSPAVYALLVFLPFFVVALWSGQRPLHLPEVGGLALYNVRFGMVMLPAAAVFTGYLVGGVLRLAAARPRPVAAALVSFAVVAACTLAVPGTATLQEALAFRASATETANARAAEWLRDHYDGGLVLMESFGNETVTFASRIPTDRIVYEGSFKRWQPALADPRRNGIRWIYIRTTSGNEDATWRALAGTPQLEHDYQLVYTDSDREIYRLRGDRG